MEPNPLRRSTLGRFVGLQVFLIYSQQIKAMDGGRNETKRVYNTISWHTRKLQVNIKKKCQKRVIPQTVNDLTFRTFDTTLLTTTTTYFMYTIIVLSNRKRKHLEEIRGLVSSARSVFTMFLLWINYAEIIVPVTTAFRK